MQRLGTEICVSHCRLSTENIAEARYRYMCVSLQNVWREHCRGSVPRYVCLIADCLERTMQRLGTEICVSHCRLSRETIAQGGYRDMCVLLQTIKRGRLDRVDTDIPVSRCGQSRL